MAYSVKINGKYYDFGFKGDLDAEIFDAIEDYMGYDFATFVFENMLPDDNARIRSCEDGLDDIIRTCNNFDVESDDIEEVINDIKMTAEYTKEDLLYW